MAGIAFLCVLPLLFFLKTPDREGPAPKVDLHLE
jgi:hypothetical protein